MIKISIFKPNGQIDRLVNCPSNSAQLQLQTNEKYVEGFFDSDAYYIDTSINAAIEKSTPPNKFCDFDYIKKTWIPNANKALEEIRSKRNKLLTESDWTQLPDVEITTKTSWAIYRQELRNITSQQDPFNIIWPTPPQG